MRVSRYRSDTKWGPTKQLMRSNYQKSVNFSMVGHSVESPIKKIPSVQRLSRVDSSESIVEDLDGSVLTKSGIETVVIKKHQQNMRSDSHVYRLIEQTEPKQRDDAAIKSHSVLPEVGSRHGPIIKASDQDYLGANNQTKRRRNYWIIANSVENKERDLKMWYNSTANPANRLKDMFDRKLQNKIEPGPYTS